MSKKIEDFGSITVTQAYRILVELYQKGLGDYPLIAMNAQGESFTISVNNSESVVEAEDQQGCLEDAEVGEKYVRVQLDY